MNHLIPSRLAVFASIIVLTICLAAPLRADHPYQVTGPVTAVSATSITVTKAGAPWTVARDAGTQVTGNLVVGAKVTIKYHMVADTVAAK